MEQCWASRLTGALQEPAVGGGAGAASSMLSVVLRALSLWPGGAGCAVGSRDSGLEVGPKNSVGFFRSQAPCVLDR